MHTRPGVLLSTLNVGSAEPKLTHPHVIFVQGEAGTGNVVEAVRHCRAVMGAIKGLQAMDDDELYVYAKEIRAPIELVRQVISLSAISCVSAIAGTWSMV